MTMFATQPELKENLLLLHHFCPCAMLTTGSIAQKKEMLSARKIT
jgi:hypothetical protein